ncbi:MAG: hypothetical protein ACFCD0_20395 [Gemmataceae bacterium]
MRDFTLALDVNEHVIFFYCNYQPSVKNVGGYFGRVYPDGGLFGKSFVELWVLGTGIHNIQLDDRQQTSRGTKPDFDDDRDQFEWFRLALFGYQHGVFTQTEVLMRALLAYTPNFEDCVRHLAPDFLRELLQGFALRMPEDLSDRSPDHVDFFSSSGTGTRIPDRNVELL